MRSRARTLHCGMFVCSAAAQAIAFAYLLALDSVLKLLFGLMCFGGAAEWVSAAGNVSFPLGGPPTLIRTAAALAVALVYLQSSVAVFKHAGCKIHLVAQLRQQLIGGLVLGLRVKIVCGVALVLRTRLSLWSGTIFSVAQFLAKEGLLDDSMGFAGITIMRAALQGETHRFPWKAAPEPVSPYFQAKGTHEGKY